MMISIYSHNDLEPEFLLHCSDWAPLSKLSQPARSECSLLPDGKVAAMRASNHITEMCQPQAEWEILGVRHIWPQTFKYKLQKSKTYSLISTNQFIYVISKDSNTVKQNKKNLIHKHFFQSEKYFFFNNQFERTGVACLWPIHSYYLTVL